MSESNHYCATCDSHIKADPEVHVEAEHDGYLAQIEVDGDFRDWNQRQRGY